MTESLYDIARHAARDLVYGGDLPGHLLEDVEQEALLWTIENPNEVADCQFEDGGYNVDRLIGRIRRGLRGLLEAERDAAYGGPRPFVSRYERETVEAVLPYVLDPHSAPPHEEAAEGSYVGAARAVDTTKFNRWTVMRADVHEGLRRLDGPDKNLLVARYVAGMTFTALASSRGVGKATAHRRVAQALDALMEHLNGDYRAPAGRRVISNAAARAITERDYGGES